MQNISNNLLLLLLQAIILETYSKVGPVIGKLPGSVIGRTPASFKFLFFFSFLFFLFFFFFFLRLVIWL